jgi:hypothetical protein
LWTQSDTQSPDTEGAEKLALTEDIFGREISRDLPDPEQLADAGLAAP